MLRETHPTTDNEGDKKSDWEYDVYFCHGSSNSRGVCILIAQHVNYDLHNDKKQSYNKDKPLFLKSVTYNFDSINYESLVCGLG